MAELTRGQKRSEVIVRARKAFREGISATRFMIDMRARGLSYRRTDMLSDWRTVNELERKADAFKYVRKEYYPTERTMAQVAWKLSHEFMYVVQVRSRITPDAPITDRNINIQSDKPLTRGQVELEAWEEIRKKYPAEIGQVEKVTPWTAMQRITE